MTTPTFTTPPTMPARTQLPAAYITNFNAFLAWLATFFTEMKTGVTWIGDRADEVAANTALAATSAQTVTAALNTSGYLALVTNSLALSVGAKSLSTGLVGKSFADTQRATLIRLSDPNARMSGLLSACNMGAGTATLTIDRVTGSGSGITDWLLILSALESVPPDLAKAQAIAFAVAL